VSAYRREVLPGYADQIGLPLDALVAIDRRSHATTWSIAARLGRRLISAWLGTQSRSDYLRSAALAIRSILAAAGCDLPVYAFGHTHTPALEPLSGPEPAAWYANAGSWAAVRPAELRRRLGSGRFGVVWIRPRTGEPPEVRLRVWDDPAGRFGSFPE